MVVNLCKPIVKLLAHYLLVEFVAFRTFASAASGIAVACACVAYADDVPAFFVFPLLAEFLILYIINL